MSRDWESSFASWAQSPSKTEQDRCERVIKAIRSAVANSSKLQRWKSHVFVQGSFRNRVNVRQDSDVDVGVMMYTYFLVEYPDGKRNVDFGNHDVDDYSFSQFKDELEEALVAHFGRSAVVRGNKAFDIKAGAMQVEADVVPLFEFRQYWPADEYHAAKFRAGVALIADDGRRIENYPERLLDSWPQAPQHYENGVSKNTETSRGFKGIVRILKKLRIELEDGGSSAASAVPGYLLECLAWNAPKACFDSDTWEGRVQSVLRHIWQNTSDSNSCDKWLEVDGIKYLFHPTQPWTRAEAHAFINAAWDHVGVKSI